MVFTISVPVAVAIAIAGIVLADTDRRHDALAVADVHDPNATRGASRNANSVDRTADQRSAVGHQHDLIAVQHRERRHDFATQRVSICLVDGSFEKMNPMLVRSDSSLPIFA